MKGTVNILPLVFVVSLLYLKIVCATDTIAAAQIIRDGDTMISAGGIFVLGFFSLSKSTNRYMGIWYNTTTLPTQPQTVVWVANREVPIANTSGSLEIIEPGLLVIRNGTNGVIWSSNYSTAVANPVAQLLDSGNLVVRDAGDDNPENYVWQSFDYPTDTLLPGMKLGHNFVTGREVSYSSWKSPEDPGQGEYTKHCDPSGYPQNLERRNGTVVFRSGPWNGQGLSGVPDLRPNPIFSYEVVLNDVEVYYSFKLLGSTFSRFTLRSDGVGQRWTWDNKSKSWMIYLSNPKDNCDSYALCGPNGSCNVQNSSLCGCLEKFEPKNPGNWNQRNWSDGCIRKTPLDCGNGDGFRKYSNFKLPDTHNSTFDRNLSLQGCRTWCLRNCSCTAYSSFDITNGGSGCLLWFGDLIDMKVIPGAGQDIYIRLASSELDYSSGKKTKKLVVILPLSISFVLLGLVLLLCSWKRNSRPPTPIQVIDDEKREIELPLLEFSKVVQATDNFSPDYLLGQGGYGPVYWGKLEDGQEVAVKRLLENNERGIDQFMTEAICIAKLQHRNLVKLLGCCIEGAERMLIYEYMPNKSLDYFIFDQTRSKSLDWPKRFHIIQGIARGLLYLHRDSRLRIIHRDLKVGNILLDGDLNPKISDFGTARSFGENQTGDNTRILVGTPGYMSPEYAREGIYSIKSDVFSYGVMVLEIISGRKNRSTFLHEGYSFNLLEHAWKLHQQGIALELVDPNMWNSYRKSEVLRAIHVGLLCVQQCPDDRPKMSSVINMLGTQELVPEPTLPGFFMERKMSTTTELTITALEAR